MEVPVRAGGMELPPLTSPRGAVVERILGSILAPKEQDGPSLKVSISIIELPTLEVVSNAISDHHSPRSPSSLP